MVESNESDWSIFLVGSLGTLLWNLSPYRKFSIVCVLKESKLMNYRRN